MGSSWAEFREVPCPRLRGMGGQPSSLTPGVPFGQSLQLDSSFWGLKIGSEEGALAGAGGQDGWSDSPRPPLRLALLALILAHSLEAA